MNCHHIVRAVALCVLHGILSNIGNAVISHPTGTCSNYIVTTLHCCHESHWFFATSYTSCRHRSCQVLAMLPPDTLWPRTSTCTCYCYNVSQGLLTRAARAVTSRRGEGESHAIIIHVFLAWRCVRSLHTSGAADVQLSDPATISTLRLEDMSSSPLRLAHVFAPLLLLAAVENIILALAVGNPKLGLVLHTPGSHTETDRHEHGLLLSAASVLLAKTACHRGVGGVDG
jgi:hypothetical protein